MARGAASGLTPHRSANIAPVQDDGWAPPPPVEPGRSSARWAVFLGANGIIAAAALLASWWPTGDDTHPPLGVGEGLGTALFVCALASVFIIPAAALTSRARRGAAMIGVALLLAVAALVGFVGVLLAAYSRCESCGEH